MGILDDMGGRQAMIPQLMQLLQMQQRDPFTRSMPGEAFLQSGAQSSNPMMGWPSQNRQQQPDPGFNAVPTDFANTPPGLPNLPDTFSGFGYGQTAPKEVQPNGIRQQIIQQLLGQLPMMMQRLQTPTIPPGFGGF